MLIRFIAFILLSATFLHAEEHLFIPHEGDRTLINGERTVEEPPVDVNEMLAKIRAEQCDEDLLAKIEVLENSLFTEKKRFGSFVYYIDSRAQNKIWTLDYNGSFIELWDGSVWTINPQDRYISRNWYITDRLYVVPVDRHFYQFKIVNMENGSYVYASMSANPLNNGVYTKKIIGIDRFFGRLILNDGTVCQVDTWDYSRVENWLIFDTIIVGINNWGSISYPYAIINTNINTPSGKSVVYVNFLN